MGTKWEKLAGDTSTFAVKLSFSDDPDEGAAASAEEAASWGSFQIWVQGMNLCAHHIDGESSDSVHWYLLPLLEWCVENWDPLFHEERLPNRNNAATASASLADAWEAPAAVDSETWERNWQEWWLRHNIESARFGGLFPSIIFRRWRDQVEISWSRMGGLAAPAGLRFNEHSGAARLPLSAVAEPLHAVLADGIDHLSSLLPPSERLRRLRRSIGEIRAGSERRLAWLLGFGATMEELRRSCEKLRGALRDLRPEARDSILGRQGKEELFAPSFSAALMFGSVSPHLDMSDRVRLIRALAEALPPQPKAPIQQLARDVSVETVRPWAQGYELAAGILGQLNVDTEEEGPVEIENILAEQGVTVGQTELHDRSIRAVAIGGARYRPTVLVNKLCQVNEYRSGRRFTLAHELCHLIFDGTHARDVAIASGDWAPSDLEVRANAFAAMLLMPPARLRRILAAVPNASWPAVVTAVANSLQTSFTAATQHLYNQGYFGKTERDALLDQAHDVRGHDGP